MMWGWNGPDSWVGWLVMSLSMVVFWGGLIFLGVWAIRSFSHSHEPLPSGSANGAVRILEERFARGEIDREEFESRRAVLQGR